MGQCNFEQTL